MTYQLTPEERDEVLNEYISTRDRFVSVATAINSEQNPEKRKSREGELEAIGLSLDLLEKTLKRKPIFEN